MSGFKKAVRGQGKLRMAIDGPPGSGKSTTAIAFATWIARQLYPTVPLDQAVAVIDTEHESASKLVGDPVPGMDGVKYDFATNILKSFSPTNYTAAIVEAASAGFKVLVIDSLSHAWAGRDGALELKDRISDGNSFTAWKNITPMHNEMVEAILQSPLHVLCTMRTKTEYVMEMNEKGKQVPKRVGTKPIQREGMEYEFDLVCDMDVSNVLSVGKTRCAAVNGGIVVRPPASWIDPVLRWLLTGEQVTPDNTFKIERLSPDQANEIIRLKVGLGMTDTAFSGILLKSYGVDGVQHLRPDQADDFISRYSAMLRNTRPDVPPPVTTQQIQEIARFKGEMILVGTIKAEEWPAMVAHYRGVKSAKELTKAEADDFIASLLARHQKLNGTPVSEPELAASGAEKS